jgi:hypothetical protein
MLLLSFICEALGALLLGVRHDCVWGLIVGWSVARNVHVPAPSGCEAYDSVIFDGSVHVGYVINTVWYGMMVFVGSLFLNYFFSCGLIQGMICHQQLAWHARVACSRHGDSH